MRPEPSEVRGIDLDIAPGTFTLITGPEGCGRNLLLHLLGLLEKADRGDVVFSSQPISRLTPEQRVNLRDKHFGFILSLPYLLPSLSTLENVAMPYFKGGADASEESMHRTVEILQHFDLLEFADTPVHELPLPLQYNLAIARAVMHSPDVLILEEPCESLPTDDRRRHLHRVAAFASLHDLTVIAAGAPALFEPLCHQIVLMRDGRIEKVSRPPNDTPSPPQPPT